MSLNIKNERVSTLAAQVVALTGKSITDAVGEALEARLAELDPRKKRAGMAERLMEIGRECAARAPKDWLTHDFDEDLYNEQGLPR